MPVVSNTSPILNLAIVDQLELLRWQFSEILIPCAVEAVAVGLDRNFLEFQRTTNAALERINRILDYLLRQQQGGS